MSYQPLAPGQTYPETPVNENMEALGQAFCFAHNKPADTGLDVGFSGGTFNGATLPDDVLTCTDDDENYVVAARADGALSVAITTTNWNNTTTYGRVARVTFVDGALTAFADERFSAGGIFDHAATATVDPDTLEVPDTGGHYTATTLTGQLQEVGAALAALSGDADTDFSFTSDTGSTADSDPGAGLFKWDNATQASATFLYVDEQTADGVNVDAALSGLTEGSVVRIVQDDAPTRWQEWELSAAPTDGTGYWKLPVTLLAASASAIQDAKACSMKLDRAGGGATGGSVDVQIITADGDWNKPSGCTLVEVVCIGSGGGGGGGGGAASGVNRYGGGGGGGAMLRRQLFRASDLPSVVACTVPAGGSGGGGGSTAVGDAGLTGSTTSFGSYLSALGGAGGAGGAITAAAVAGGAGAGYGTSSATARGTQPGAVNTTTGGGYAEHGGGGGGGTGSSGTAAAGGGSLYSAAGGGPGGRLNTSNTAAYGVGNAAGLSGDYNTAGGVSGGNTSGGAGTDGSINLTTGCGSGGGGGGPNASGTGGAGGAGGVPGGGGGGGGGGTSVGGAGGAGGRGEIRVYSW